MKMLYDWGWRSRNYISVSIDLLERQEDKHWFLIVDKEADRAQGILLCIYVGIIFELYLINIPDPQNNQRRGQTKDALDRVCVQWSLTLLWWWRPRRDGLCWISSNIIFTTTHVCAPPHTVRVAAAHNVCYCYPNSVRRRTDVLWKK